jgi:anti-sigma factor RsiW
MSCETMTADLVGYHFGSLEPGARDAVEAHLASCASCVRAFIALKRDVELAESAPGPSASARARLRAEAAALLAPPAPRWAWWERPLALSLAGAAVLFGVFFVGSVATQPARAPLSLSAPR